MFSYKIIFLWLQSLNLVHSSKVILIVTEGLTENLLNNVATPAIDSLVTKGTVASLRPEFPAELLPTLQAMMTGQHSEVTGVIDEVVTDGDSGLLHFDRDPEYWNYAPNLTTIWVIGNC